MILRRSCHRLVAGRVAAGQFAIARRPVRPQTWRCSSTDTSAEDAEHDSTAAAAAAEQAQLPPWRQKKPWRWYPEEEEQTWLLSLPREQEAPETGRSTLLTVSVLAVGCYFTFYWWAPAAGSAYQ
eukprot:TRINITY_DN43134_c0_g1_i4.p1 TRINITY_DN43134_c0_g1~~TRINITY_DN43134_c0_g1_i4.p1  ORF type:complete len:125 (-),score=20.58 TRINITY_DN43134_c0_g1_i4:111-485(-)